MGVGFIKVSVKCICVIVVVLGIGGTIIYDYFGEIDIIVVQILCVWIFVVIFVVY